jgi:aminoglycoside phosphotransferase (APT) family kinase protein
MRRFPVIAFQAERIAYLRGRRVASAELFPGGSCNSSYRVELDTGAVVVVRFYSRGAPAHDAQIFGLVQGVVPVPVILDAGEDWAVMTMLPGQPLGDEHEAQRDAGRALARIASVRLQRPGRIMPDGSIQAWPFGETGGFVRTFLAKDEVRRWLGAETVRGVEKLIEDEAGRLAEIAADARLVHGDFNPENILIEGDRVSGVLDWEFAHSGTPYMDLGNLRRHVGSERAALAAMGFEDEGLVLPADWQFRAAVVDLSSHLEFLTSAKPDAFKATCVERVQALLAWPRQGAPAL